ncbi:MAG: hypothetical protein ING77_12950 [Rhodocyclaceae bacterium]|jgi:hypothetical protein|nr:hypothetical protein [Rhodocyclaceae bacterium]
MTRKRTPYKPRPVLATPFTLTRPAPKAKREKVLFDFYTALDAMACGKHPGEQEWRSLSDAVNTVETLAVCLRKLESAEVMPLVHDAILALVGASERFKAGQGMRLDGPGLQALRDVVDVYRQCMEGLTEHEMAVAQAETQQRLNRVLRAKQTRHTVVTL